MKLSSGRGIHTRQYQGQTNDWITPRWLTERLGQFDLDPCASVGQIWHHADQEFTINEDGLAQKWEGRVWLNPPYGPHAEAFLKRLAEHGDGVALVAARVETKWFHRWVWERADAVLFLEGRLQFHKPDGTLGRWTAGHGSVLVAYGDYNATMLGAANCAKRMGRFVQLKKIPEAARSCGCSVCLRGLGLGLMRP